MRRVRGFTLVELLVVLTILGVMMAMVGPLAVDRLDKARAQEEWLVLDRTLRSLAFRAFADGRDVEIRAEGAQVTWRIAGADERALTLGHIFFDEPQVVRINTNGIAVPSSLALHQGRRARTLELNGWLGDGT